MKAPDKIYVGVGTLSSNQPTEEYAFPGWQEKPCSQIRSEEYIRKEVLLKYLNNYKTVLNNDEELYRLEKAAAVYAIEEVINHINEM